MPPDRVSLDGRTGRQPGRVGQTPRTPDRPAGLRVHARATTSRDEHSRAATSVCERLLFVAAVRKRFPTVVTFCMVYPRVHSSVDCQAVAVGKRLPTDVTSVWFIPRAH